MSLYLGSWSLPKLFAALGAPALNPASTVGVLTVYQILSLGTGLCLQGPTTGRGLIRMDQLPWN